MKKYFAECIGTAILVLLGCGSAVFIKDIGILGVALAFGLSIVGCAYVVGPISGCHINPAVSMGMLVAGKMSVKDFCGYVVAQVIGGLVGAAILYAILSMTSIGLTQGLGANGFATAPLNLTAGGALLTEVVLTFVFVFAILGVTAKAENGAVAGLVIGGTLALVHILGINLTGTSVNPARSLAPAIFLGGEALKQVWVFIVAPLVGGALAAVAYRMVGDKK